MAVSIKTVSQRTKSINDPIRIAPGIRKRLAARMRMTKRKRIVRPLVMIAKLDIVNASKLLF